MQDGQMIFYRSSLTVLLLLFAENTDTQEPYLDELRSIRHDGHKTFCLSNQRRGQCTTDADNAYRCCEKSDLRYFRRLIVFIA
jgi:hypothetical protein